MTSSISSILLNTSVEGRFYDILLDNADHNGKKVVVSVLTDDIELDASNTAIKLLSTVDVSNVQVELTDKGMDDLLKTDASAALQFIVRTGATKLGSKVTTLDKSKMVIPEIEFDSDEGNSEKAKVTFDVSYGDYTPYDDASTLSSVIVEYHEEGDDDAKVIELSGGDLTVTNDGKKISVSITGLTNNTVYEYIVTGKNSAGETNSITNKVRPVNNANPPTFENVESLVTNGVPDPSNVKITINWTDDDAENYKNTSSDASSNSTIKLRIGTATDISSKSDVFDASNVVPQFHEVFLTNAQLTTAKTGLTLTLESVDIIKMASSANTTGVELKAQLLPGSMLDSGNEGLSGEISLGKVAYIESVPTLEEITVSLDASTGTQTFTVNGTVPSKDSTGVKLIMHNSETDAIFVDLSNTDVLTDGSLDIIETKGVQQWYKLNADPTITANLSQADRNGTQDANIGAPYVYSVDVSFRAYQLKIPNAPTVEFLGNVTDGGKLLTKLTDLSNNGDQFDVIGTDVRYELCVNAAGDALTPPVDVSYVDLLNTILEISHNYDTAQNYYLKATKYASLNDTVADVYSDDISQNQEIETAVLGPLKATTSASLDLSAIQVSVDASGVQTFYVNGSITSLDASRATLTISNSSGNGSDNFVTDEVVEIDTTTGKITEIFGTRTYDQLLLKPRITATLTQPDLNGVGFDLSVDISFITHAFKTPEVPDASDSLSKNIVGNDGKLRANYTAASDLKDMNGYDLVSVTAQINGLGLSDVSGAFDQAVDADATFHVNVGTNQNIDLSYGDYDVDTSYSMILKKKYALDDVVFDRYYVAKRGSNIVDLSGGVLDSTQSNTVFYMGNPEITKIDVSGGANTVTVEVDTHGADLTTEDAVTLVLVAKDGLAGYADGTNTGKMGSIVMTVNADGVANYTTSVLGNQEVIATFDLSGGITDNASSVVIVDATNSHSAVSLSNFPAVATSSSQPNALDAKYNASTN